MSYTVNWNPVILGRNWLPNVESWAVTTGGSGGAFNVHALCPTREAAEAARRLLSGECERAKEPEPLRGYLLGISDGAAQERARIVRWMRAKATRGERAETPAERIQQRTMSYLVFSMADLLERGDAGE